MGRIIARILMQSSSLASLHSRTVKDDLFTQMFTLRDRQSSSIPSALSSSDHLSSSNIRVLMTQQRQRSRSEKSRAFSRRERPSQKRYTGYAEKIHDCSEAKRPRRPQRRLRRHNRLRTKQTRARWALHGKIGDLVTVLPCL